MIKSLKKLCVIPVIIALLFSSVLCVSAEEQHPVLNTRDDFMWGVNKHSSFYSVYSDANLEEQIHYMAEMGAKILRIDCNVNNLVSTDKTVKLCNAYGIKVMFVMGGVSGEEANYDYEGTYRIMNTFANRYNGKSGHGKVDYIQIDNECDIKNEFWTRPDLGAGSSTSDYNSEKMEYVCKRFNNYAKAIRDADNDIQIVINHGWTHTGFIDWLVQRDVDFDIVGLDWYTDMSGSFELQGRRPAEQLEVIYNKYHKDIIICESNFWSSGEIDDNDVSNWDSLIRLIDDAYTYPYLKGFIIYELCDNLGMQGNGPYNREAHFGIIFADKYGSLVGPKPIYHKLKQIWGGTETKMITFDDLANQGSGNTSSTTSTSSTSEVSNSTDTSSGKTSNNTSTTNKGTSSVTTDKDTESDFDLDIDDEDEDTKKESSPAKKAAAKKPVEKFVWSTENTIAVVIGGVGVILAAAFVAYIIIRSKQIKKLSGK